MVGEPEIELHQGQKTTSLRVSLVNGQTIKLKMSYDHTVTELYRAIDKLFEVHTTHRFW